MQAAGAGLNKPVSIKALDHMRPDAKTIQSTMAPNSILMSCKACEAHQTDLTCSSDGADARESGAGFHSEAVSVTAIGLLRANA